MADVQRLFGFKTDYPRIEKSLENHSDRRNQQQKQDKKKKQSDETEDVLAGLASSLGQYQQTEREFYQ